MRSEKEEQRSEPRSWLESAVIGLLLLGVVAMMIIVYPPDEQLEEQLEEKSEERKA